MHSFMCIAARKIVQQLRILNLQNLTFLPKYKTDRLMGSAI
jgi:hypothetical protein